MILRKTSDNRLELKLGNLFWENEKAPSDDYFSAKVIYSRIGDCVGVNVGGVAGKVGCNAGVNVGGVTGKVGGNAGVNIGGVIGIVEGDARVNLSGYYGVVEGNAGVNVGGVVGGVDGNAGVNVGGLVGGVGGNAGVNVGGVIGIVEGSLRNYTIGQIAPRITKYLPKWLRETSIPAVNLGGVYTFTKRPKNGIVLGLVNYLKEAEKGDYVALGGLNIVRTPEGGLRFRPILSGRVHFDGIIRHKNSQDSQLNQERESAQ